MARPSYSQIAHLIRSEQVTPHEVSFHFVSDCGRLEQIVVVCRAAGQPASPDDSQGSLARWLKHAIRTVLGNTPPVYLTPTEREKLSLQAFEQVAPALTQVGGRWVGLTQAARPGQFFEHQLRAAPVLESYDREVLTRALLEISRADSEWRPEEKNLLEEVGAEPATVARLQRAPNLSVAEMSNVSAPQVKQTILMLCWAMAYVDGTLDPRERDHLETLKRGFMLSEPQVRRLQLAAKLALLDRYLATLRGRVSSQQLRESFNGKALEWGVHRGNLDKLHAWYPQDFSSDEAPLTAEEDTLLQTFNNN